MKRSLPFLAACLFACVTIAQDAASLQVLPSTGKAVGLVRTTSTGRWFVLAADLAPVKSEAFKLTPEAGGGSLIFWEGNPGSRYTVLFVPDSSAEPLGATVVTLGGNAPVEPPDPPITPPDEPPVTAAVKALILLETETSDQRHELIRQAIRRDKSLSAKVLILDPNTKDESDQPDKQVQAALKHLGNRPLPRILALDSSGGFVGDAELPATAEAVKTWLSERGIK